MRRSPIANKPAKWIAAGFLFTAVYRFAFGHPEPKDDTLPIPAEVTERTGRAVIPPPAPAAVPPPSGGASFLSLIEVGPAEIEVTPAAPAKAAAPAPAASVDSVARTVSDEADRRAKRRQDRQAIRAVATALYSALTSCSKQQLLRNPRQQGEIDLSVTVVPQPGTDRGRIQELTIDSPRMFIPLFDGCIRSAMSSASIPSPVLEVKLSTTHRLELEVSAPDDSDDDDNNDSGEDGSAAEAAAAAGERPS